MLLSSITSFDFIARNFDRRLVNTEWTKLQAGTTFTTVCSHNVGFGGILQSNTYLN